MLQVKKLTAGVDWAKIDVIILLNHGIFTWGNDAKSSYRRMVEMVPPRVCVCVCVCVCMCVSPSRRTGAWSRWCRPPPPPIENKQFYSFSSSVSFITHDAKS